MSGGEGILARDIVEVVGTAIEKLVTSELLLLESNRLVVGRLGDCAPSLVLLLSFSSRN